MGGWLFTDGLYTFVSTDGGVTWTRVECAA